VHSETFGQSVVLATLPSLLAYPRRTAFHGVRRLSFNVHNFGPRSASTILGSSIKPEWTIVG
jgi:hypothetical protein